MYLFSLMDYSFPFSMLNSKILCGISFFFLSILASVANFCTTSEIFTIRSLFLTLLTHTIRITPFFTEFDFQVTIYYGKYKNDKFFFYLFCSYEAWAWKIRTT